MRNVFVIASKLVGEKKAVQIALAATNKVNRRHKSGDRIASHATDYLYCIQNSYPFCRHCCGLMIGQHEDPNIHNACAEDIAWQEDFRKQCAAEHAARLVQTQARKAADDAIIAQLEAEFASEEN